MYWVRILWARLSWSAHRGWVVPEGAASFRYRNNRLFQQQRRRGCGRVEFENVTGQRTLTPFIVLSPSSPQITNLVKFDSQTMPQRAFRLQLFQQGFGFDDRLAGNTWAVKQLPPRH